MTITCETSYRAITPDGTPVYISPHRDLAAEWFRRRVGSDHRLRFVEVHIYTCTTELEIPKWEPREKTTKTMPIHTSATDAALYLLGPGCSKIHASAMSSTACIGSKPPFSRSKLGALVTWMKRNVFLRLMEEVKYLFAGPLA